MFRAICVVGDAYSPAVPIVYDSCRPVTTTSAEAALKTFESRLERFYRIDGVLSPM